jgi:hypothetical protein
VFRNNRNKQKTNRNSSKFVKVSSCLVPHTISSVCFGCFYTVPKHRNKLKKKFFGFAKKQTGKKPKQIEFRFELRKKNLQFRGLPNRERFLEIFLVCFDKVLFVSILVQNTEKNQKNVFWFRETNRKTTKTDLVSVCFGSNRKKNLIVLRTLFAITVEGGPRK